MTEKMKEPIPRVLLYAGLMGHEFVLIEKSDHETAVDGWVSRAECNSLDSALRETQLDRDWRVYRRDDRAWRQALASDPPNTMRTRIKTNDRINQSN